MSKGKKVLAALAILALAVALLFGWVHVRKDLILSEKDILPAIQRAVGTDAPLTLLDEYDNTLDGSRLRRLLLCYTTDGMGVPTFYAVALEKAFVGYKCHNLIVVNRGPDIYMVTWADGEVLMIGNPDVAYIQLSRRNPAGETVQIPVTSVPFSYYWDRSVEPWATDVTSFSYEYFFYNHAGEALTK